MEHKPHQHLWAYKGLEYEVGDKIEGVEGYGSFRERRYADVYFCQHCLEEKSVPRDLANDTSQPPIDGTTPRGRQPGEVLEELKEEEAPAPIEHGDPGKLAGYETYGWFPKGGERRECHERVSNENHREGAVD